MSLLLDEMYPPRLAEELRAAGIDAVTVAELHLSAVPDAEAFIAAVGAERTVLTENVADFIRIAAARNMSGGHYHGVLIALSSRFSRCAAGIGSLVAAVQAVARENLDDRVIYLRTVRASD